MSSPMSFPSMCDLCFREIAPDDYWRDENGDRWSVHRQCKETDEIAADLKGCP